MPEAAAGEPVGGVRAASAVPGAALGVLALPGVSVRGRERLPRPAGAGGAWVGGLRRGRKGGAGGRKRASQADVTL